MTVHLVPEKDLTRDQERCIQDLLIAAFPQYKEIWSRQSFYGGPAEYRVWLEHSREAVLGFYEKAGFTLHRQTVYCFHPGKQTWIYDDGAKMVMPIHRGLDEWNANGLIDLRGMPW